MTESFNYCTLPSQMFNASVKMCLFNVPTNNRSFPTLVTFFSTSTTQTNSGFAGEWDYCIKKLPDYGKPLNFIRTSSSSAEECESSSRCEEGYGDCDKDSGCLSGYCFERTSSKREGIIPNGYKLAENADNCLWDGNTNSKCSSSDLIENDHTTDFCVTEYYDKYKDTDAA